MYDNYQIKVHFYPVISDDGYRMGDIKYDGHRENLQWTALGWDGRRLKDCETQDEAWVLILNQNVSDDKLIKEIY